ncbi:MAG: SPOR domain-containing protein [Bacteroidota bacterium]|nr:SPOR domain-containing protein [Bacteroidota bacterium]
MKIISLIKTLLLTNDKFSITGLGTFISTPKSAIINKATREITPPTKGITFDTDVEQKDTIIRDALLSKGLSKEDASLEIAKFVDDVKKALSNNDNYQIPELGFFFKNREGKIEFSDRATISLIPEATGFSKISIKKQAGNNKSDLNTSNEDIVPEKIDKKKNISKKEKRRIEQEKKQKLKEERKLKKEQEKRLKKEQKLKSKANKNTPDKHKAIVKDKKVKKEKTKTAKTPEQKAKSKKFARSLLVIIPIIVLLGAVGYFHKPIIKQAKDLIAKVKDTTKTNDNIVIDDSLVDTSNANVTDLLGNDDEYKKLLNSGITNTADVNLGENYKKFYIIAGSFSTNQNAQQYAKQLQNFGYSPVIIDGTGQNYYRVALGAYNKADNLKTDYTNFTNKYKKELWVLINKE